MGPFFSFSYLFFTTSHLHQTLLKFQTSRNFLALSVLFDFRLPTTVCRISFYDIRSGFETDEVPRIFRLHLKTQPVVYPICRPIFLRDLWRNFQRGSPSKDGSRSRVDSLACEAPSSLSLSPFSPSCRRRRLPYWLSSNFHSWLVNRAKI